MKVVKRTETHTIYQKRSKRYAVQDSNKRYVNGEEKAQILKDAGLITQPKPKAEEAPAAEESAGEE